MLFNISDALRIRNHYKEIMVGTPLTPGNHLKIDGVFICHKGNVLKAIDILRNTNFDEGMPMIAVSDEELKDLEVYVYAFDGANVYYHDLDKNISEKGITKIY